MNEGDLAYYGDPFFPAYGGTWYEYKGPLTGDWIPPQSVYWRGQYPLMHSTGDPFVSGAMWAYNNVLGSVFPLKGLGAQMDRAYFAPSGPPA